MDSETGTRLKEIRTKTGLSQRQLAKASGVANATISQIESGAINPTVGMLKKVLGGIPISLSNFFADDFSFSEQVFFSADNLLELGDKGVSYLQVGNHLHSKSMQMMKECYQPGATTGKHAIQHEGEECGIILSGSLEVQVGDEKKVLNAGDAYYFKSTIPHHFKNIGRERCELITACSPPSF
jgi:transcriptional regulator with XRE-family HTH domain